MPSDKPDKVEHWRHPVSAVKTLTPTAFAEKVLEDGLRVVGPHGGYLYAAVNNEDGFDMIRTGDVLWEVDLDFQQTNAAGGAIVCDISVATETSMRLMAWRVTNTGTNTVQTLIINSNANGWYLNNISSGAGTSGSGPQSLANSGTSGTIIASQPNDARLIPGGCSLRFLQTGAGAQNDHFKLWFYAILEGTSTAPTISKAASTNAGDVTTTTNVNLIRMVPIHDG